MDASKLPFQIDVLIYYLSTAQYPQLLNFSNTFVDDHLILSEMFCCTSRQKRVDIAFLC